MSLMLLSYYVNNMNNKITNIVAKEILDSRNNPTLEVSVFIDEAIGTFSVPSGASTGMYEAFELRDGDNGKSGIGMAINAINDTILPALIGIDIHNQQLIDKTMIDLDGTVQKKNLGGNSMIGVSIACAKAAAKINNQELYEYLRTFSDIQPTGNKPFLYFNLINGGKHASSKLAFQEYHIVPQGDTIKENTEMCKKIQSALDDIIIKEYGSLPIKGDEGGFALQESHVIKPLSLLKNAVDSIGLTDRVKFALDVAASSFYNKETRLYNFDDRTWTNEEMIDLYEKIVNDYPMISIEDPFDEEDYESFSKLQKIIPDVKLIGDDLTVTNVDRLSKAIEKESIKGIIIKPNQIGTLTETLNTISLAYKNKIDCIVSHRSGETMDDFIADLAYAFGCFGIKAGALGPKERDVKYNRLINIEKQ